MDVTIPKLRFKTSIVLSFHSRHIGVLAKFLSTRQELESFEKREPPLRKCPAQDCPVEEACASFLR